MGIHEQVDAYGLSSISHNFGILEQEGVLDGSCHSQINSIVVGIIYETQSNCKKLGITTASNLH